MKKRLCFILLTTLFTFSLVACGNKNNVSNPDPQEISNTTTTEAKAGGDWSCMYGGNYAKILCEDFGLKQYIATDIGAVLEDYSCDVNEIYEVTQDGKYAYFITYKDNAGTTWEKQHLIMSKEDHGYWLVEDRTDTLEMNKTFLQNELGLNENRTEGAAIQLDKAGCGIIVKSDNRNDSEHAYSITLINKDGDKYHVTFSKDGNIRIIQNEAGDYLLAPID